MKANFDELNNLTEKGFLKREISKYGDLVLYNYTDKCTYKKHWNEYTLNARGTVYELSSGKVIARGFPKFFNFEELPISDSVFLSKHTDFEVTEKVDGSLGIIYWYNGKWMVNTRGSFTSDQAIRGAEILKRKYELKVNNSTIKNTYLVEIIYPENKIIVDYGDKEELILLAVIDTETGNELNRSWVNTLRHLSPKLKRIPIIKMIPLNTDPYHR